MRIVYKIVKKNNYTKKLKQQQNTRNPLLEMIIYLSIKFEEKTVRMVSL